jgi:endonuclease-3
MKARQGKRAPAKKKGVAVRRAPRAELRRQAERVWAGLLALYPDAHCELDFRSPWELLVATILSAQCTDKRVNLVTPTLFARYPTPVELAKARAEDVEAIIQSTGFFRAKTKSILGAAKALVERHGAAVPGSMEELVGLPGVGRKTANVVLGNAFGASEGVVVDTHVERLAQRLGLSKETDPIRIERDLMELFPRERWTMLGHLLIWHGRRVCVARKPRCPECTLASFCPSARI